MSWLSNDINKALKIYDQFELDKNSGCLTGELNIINPETNDVLEAFSIQILFPLNYPYQRLPIVKELGHKIPRHPDRHVYPDGTFCLTTPIKEFLICRKGITLTKFIEEILRPFLATQMAISLGWLDSFPQGEYEHGANGIYESYSEYFGITDLTKIILGLEMTQRKNQRNSKCFCGNGLKLKKCHLELVNTLRMMSKNLVQKDLAFLRLIEPKFSSAHCNPTSHSKSPSTQQSISSV